MTERQIIEITIELNQSCLSKEEKYEVYDLFVKYRGAFSLRDEVSTCASVEVELQVIDVSICHKTFACRRGRQGHDR